MFLLLVRLWHPIFFIQTLSSSCPQQLPALKQLSCNRGISWMGGETLQGELFSFFRPQLPPSQGRERSFGGWWKGRKIPFFASSPLSKTYTKNDTQVFFCFCSGQHYKNLFSPLSFGAFERCSGFPAKAPSPASTGEQLIHCNKLT